MNAAVSNKLSVNKRTIRTLSLDETDAVAGGTTAPCAIAIASSEPCAQIIATIIITIAKGCS